MSIGFTAREVIPSKAPVFFDLHFLIYIILSHFRWILHLRYVTLPLYIREDDYMMLGLGFVVSLTGRIAATYHVPFPVLARVSLCVIVCIIPTSFR